MQCLHTARERSGIEVSDVRKSFVTGDVTVEALRGVSFRVPTGSCTFIVGPSGSGKSTLLYLMGALDRPTSGTIRVEDREITAMTESEQDDYRRNQVGFIYQSFNLISNLSSVGNVLVPYIPLGVTPDLRAKAEELLRQVGMGDRLKHRRTSSQGDSSSAWRWLGRDQGSDADPGRRANRHLDRAGGDEIIRLLRIGGRRWWS